MKTLQLLTSTLMEMSLVDLESSTENAFPETKGRYERIHAVQIISKEFVQVDKNKLKVEATCKGETKTYTPIIEFSNVTFTNMQDPTGHPLTPTLAIEPIDTNAPVEVRCNCMDFYMTFAYFNAAHGSLYGEVPPPIEKSPNSNRGPRNPTKSPGLCKHIMKLGYELNQEGAIHS